MQIIVNGLMTHYQQSGKGKIVLLLHGWADKLETFQAITPLLAECYSVLAVDLPGFGKTEPPKNAWDLDDYADFVHAFLQKLGTEDVYAVVGHSNGGALAIRALATDKLQAQKLVLLAASGVRDTAKLRRTATKVVAKTGKVATFWLPKNTKQKLQKKLYGTVGSDMLVAPHLQETFKKTVRQDVQVDARQLQLPTLLMYGDHDTATPIDQVAVPLHEQIKHSKLYIIHGADHFVHQQAAAEVAGHIQEFLK